MSATAERAPDWLLRPESPVPPAASGSRRRRSFLARTLDGAADTVRSALLSEELAAGSGVLQRLDPRAKLVALLALLVGVALLREPAALLAANAVVLAVAAAGGVGAGLLVRRVWPSVALFTGLVLLPATLSAVVPGRVIVPLWTWRGVVVGLTAQGLTGAALVLLRVIASLSLVVLLTATTSWTRLLAALRALGLPRFVVMVVGMAHRYVFLLLDVVTEMTEARAARTVGRPRHDRGARRFVGASAGTLIAKAHGLSEEVHQAMMARGYRGDPRTLEPERLTRRDVASVAVTVALAVAAVAGDRILG